MNRKKILEILAFEYILVFGMLSRYVEYREEWRVWIIRIGILVLFVSPLSYKIITKNWVLCILIALITCFFYFSAGLYGDRTNLDNNYKFFIYTFLCSVFVFWLSQTDIDWFWGLLKKHFFILNGFFIINLFVVFLQLQNTGFLIKASWLESNPFYTDQCAGLFGKSGTHQLAIFSIFMLIYNLQFAEEVQNTKLRYSLFAYTYISMFCSMYLSTRNENTAIFVLYALVLIFYYAVKAYLLKWNIKIIFKMLVPLAAFFIILLLIIPRTNYFITHTLLKRIVKVTSDISSSASGSNERLAIVSYALQLPETYLFGYGLGSWGFGKSGLYGFQHFGINSISSFIALGGIWFYLLVSIMYTLVFCRINPASSRKNKILMFIIMFLGIQVLAVYTPIYTNEVTMLWAALIFFVFVMHINNNKKDVDKNRDIHKQGIELVYNQLSDKLKNSKKKIIVLCVFIAAFLTGARLFMGITSFDDWTQRYNEEFAIYSIESEKYKNEIGVIDSKIEQIEMDFANNSISQADYDNSISELKKERSLFKHTAPTKPMKPTYLYVFYRAILYGLFGFLISFYFFGISLYFIKTKK